MSQLTVRGLKPELERRIRELAHDKSISLNKAAVRLMERGAKLRRRKKAGVIGSRFDDLIGTWTDREAEQLLEAIKAFETIDESLWR